MAPKGPMLPRKSTALARSRGTLQSVAFQIGTIVAVERNRRRMTQDQLAQSVGARQIDVSTLENGERLPKTVKDQQIDKLFATVDLPRRGLHANFVKWWRDNAP
ncbi:MAG TPA: helix-turn-helix domain-containing protein [Solirubrobacterales bacterium]|jgi:ribosome-binding protein aMBF1 (putative translation factor)